MNGGALKVRFTILIAFLAVVALLIAGGCSHKNKAYQPKINPEFLDLSKDQIFEKGGALYENRKWRKAREYFTHVYENYPNDPLARRSLLRIADTYFKEGGPVNLVEAQYKYRDFINRYPGSEQADYAMLQIANVSFEQMEKPDRDQTKTREAIQKYKEMIEMYPNSAHRGEAEDHMRRAYDSLAWHEHDVARFYLRRQDFAATLPRLELVLRDYPDYSRRSQVYLDYAVALAGVARVPEARLYFERVVTEYPKSDQAKEAKKRLEKLPV